MSITQRTLALALLPALLVTLPSPAAEAQTPRMLLGLDLASADAQIAAGVRPDLGMMWIGAWTLKSGWYHGDSLLDKAYRTGVTPVIQFYYWGNDISPSCLENGCWSSIHGAHKSKAGWSELANQMTSHLWSRLHGRTAYIVIETEFNKGAASTYEPLDGYLAEKARAIKAQYPNARVVLGFGNWGSASWGTFDRAAAASDLVGLQGLRAATRDSYASYVGLADATLSGARTLQARFHKPILLTDIGLSSHWEPTYVSHQSTAVGILFSRLGDFQAAGVQGMVYRSFRDSPGATTAEYFGEAERHWGLAWADGRVKPAWQKWRDGAIGAGSGSGSTTSSTTTSYPKAPGAGGTPLTIEAERFAQRPVGGMQGDGTASAGQRWNLWANGKISQPVQFPAAGTYEVRIRTQGQVLGNVAPHLNVFLDGQWIAGGDPWSGSWKDYAGRVHVGGAGVRTVHLQFTNDAYQAGVGDRNLLLDKVQISWVSS